MADISTLWSQVRGDWKVAGADLASGNDIVTATLISLFSDRVADQDDVISDGTTDPRGWWGDDDLTPIGSRLWLIERSKKTQATLSLAQQYVEEALQWLIDDGVATSVDVFCEWTREQTLGARVTVYQADQAAAPVLLQTTDLLALPEFSRWSWNSNVESGEWVDTTVAKQPMYRVTTDGSPRVTTAGDKRITL